MARANEKNKPNRKVTSISLLSGSSDRKSWACTFPLQFLLFPIPVLLPSPFLGTSSTPPIPLFLQSRLSSTCQRHTTFVYHASPQMHDGQCHVFQSLSLSLVSSFSKTSHRPWQLMVGLVCLGNFKDVLKNACSRHASHSRMPSRHGQDTAFTPWNEICHFLMFLLFLGIARHCLRTRDLLHPLRYGVFFTHHKGYCSRVEEQTSTYTL